MITVLLVEDHQLTRESLFFGLSKCPDIQVVGEAKNGQEAVSEVEKHTPDMVLMDIALPMMNGIQATQAIKQQHPGVKVVMLTSHNEQENVFNAFAAGAEGYCMKDIKLERLVQVMEMVMEGSLWLDPSIAGLILKVMPMIAEKLAKTPSSPAGPKIELSAREHEILALIAEGLNNKDIADRLIISLFTVKNHVRSIIQKLAVDDRTQAAIYALKNGLI